MPPLDLLAFRPCGPCRAYVSADKGCSHWRPKTARALAERTPEQRAAAAAARHRQRANAAAVVAQFAAMMTP